MQRMVKCSCRSRWCWCYNVVLYPSIIMKQSWGFSSQFLSLVPISIYIELHSYLSNISRFLLHESKILYSRQSLASIFKYAICIMEVNPLCWPTSTKCMYQKSCFRQNGWLIQCKENFFRYSCILLFQKIDSWVNCTWNKTTTIISREVQRVYYQSVTAFPSKWEGKNWMDKAFIS